MKEHQLFSEKSFREVRWVNEGRRGFIFPDNSSLTSRKLRPFLSQTTWQSIESVNGNKLETIWDYETLPEIEKLMKLFFVMPLPKHKFKKVWARKNNLLTGFWRHYGKEMRKRCCCWVSHFAKLQHSLQQEVQRAFSNSAKDTSHRLVGMYKQKRVAQIAASNTRHDRFDTVQAPVDEKWCELSNITYPICQAVRERTFRFDQVIRPEVVWSKQRERELGTSGHLGRTNVMRECVAGFDMWTHRSERKIDPSSTYGGTISIQPTERTNTWDVYRDRRFNCREELLLRKSQLLVNGNRTLEKQHSNNSTHS